MLIGKDEKLVIQGDSITDCGRTRPVAEGLFDPLGRGYATFVDAMLCDAYPELGIRVVNVGCSGDTTRELKKRWQTDTLDLKPDWLSILIGVNDVWRQFDSPRIPEHHVGLEEYEKNYDELLAQTRPLLKGLVLMTPYFIEPNRQDPMRVRMEQYADVTRKLAKKYDAVLVDLQAAFDRRLQYCHPMAITWDRIHPNQAGHMTIARAMLKALGFDR